MEAALEGITVLDLSRLAPGPYCSMLLGDMGADVILVEEAGAPRGRRAGRQRPDMRGDNETPEGRRRTAYNVFGRNKRSLRLNLKTEEGRAIFYRLAADADVVLEGYRPA